MRVVKINANNNGSHENTLLPDKSVVPKGWVEIPSNLDIPESFPFVDLVFENDKLIAMSSREVPHVDPIEEPVSPFDRLEAQVMYTAMMTNTEIT